MTDHANRPAEDAERGAPASPSEHARMDALRDANEQLVIASMRNQTLADEAAAARADAEAASRAKDEFLAMVSHELRTPLGAVLGSARLLARGQLDETRTLHAIHVIERNSKAAARIIDDLLDVSRIERGNVDLGHERVDVRTVVQDALDAIRLAAEGKTVDVDCVYPAEPIAVAGDALRLTEVVENLLSNALKFTPAGGRVEVRVSSSGSQAEVRVSDTGQGISPEFLPHLFDRFAQADTGRSRRDGIGLGLAIVKAFTEAHGGSVHADSAGAGQGATFTVRLPLVSPREAVDTVERGAADSTSIAPARLDGVSVLLVEDDADAREVLRLSLDLAGAKVEATASVREALRAFDCARPDVLVSDIGMPDEDGYELIRQIRARAGGDVPAIALTGYVDARHRARLLAAGFQTHLRKPVDPDVLEAAVAALASLRRR